MKLKFRKRNETPPFQIFIPHNIFPGKTKEKLNTSQQRVCMKMKIQTKFLLLVEVFGGDSIDFYLKDRDVEVKPICFGFITTLNKFRYALQTMLVDIFAGTMGGIAVVLVGHPFDTTKTRLQTAPNGFYSCTIDCVKKTVQWEGVSGFYAGIWSPLYGKST